ncbi:hypothetical protein [Spartinivicinus poritis]|uniref:Lipoprotein n=1 Tax=Spartinivicinus poritis TaxID=2994640 RepID=A0ABT5U9A8_9GAMM|nr:hypothetical protein [Spartinivicinus sp. A2-2]MDE1462951.1 hypothetical protein [Spartinivicinus sp. A2-2]
MLKRVAYSCFLISALLISGCSHIAKQQAQYPLSVYYYTQGDFVNLRAYLPEGEPAGGAQLEVFDDFNRLIINKSLNDEGFHRFRFPSNKVRLTAYVTSQDGRKGRRYIEREDRDLLRKRLLWYNN